MRIDLYYEVVYDFYKRLYPNETFLFHVSNEYVAVNNDAVRVADVLNLPISNMDKISLCCFSEDMLNDAVFRLVQANIAVHIVEYRDNSENFALPKVKQILDDIESDY